MSKIDFDNISGLRLTTKAQFMVDDYLDVNGKNSSLISITNSMQMAKFKGDLANLKFNHLVYVLWGLLLGKYPDLTVEQLLSELEEKGRKEKISAWDNISNIIEAVKRSLPEPEPETDDNEKKTQIKKPKSKIPKKNSREKQSK